MGQSHELDWNEWEILTHFMHDSLRTEPKAEEKNSQYSPKQTRMGKKQKEEKQEVLLVLRLSPMMRVSIPRNQNLDIHTSLILGSLPVIYLMNHTG